MEFPRRGLIRNLTDGAVICTWDYPRNEGDPEQLTGACPFVDYDDKVHEVIDLTECSPDDYVNITTHQEEAILTKTDKKEEWELWRKDKDGGAPVKHEVGTITEEKPIVDPPSDPPVDPPIDPKAKDLL